MGSDYNYQRIVRFETMNGVNVPVDKYGHFLRWDDKRPGNDSVWKARELTNPYGVLAFAVGFGDEGDEDGDWFQCFDYAELPDGRMVLHSVINTESGGYIQTAGYEVVSKQEAAPLALSWVESALDMIGEEGRKHDEEGWNQDPYYFVRAVAKYCGIKTFLGMGQDQLRRGIYPGDTLDGQDD